MNPPFAFPQTRTASTTVAEASWPFWKRALTVHVLASLIGGFMGVFWHFKLMARGIPSHWLEATIPDVLYWNLWVLPWPIFLRLAEWTLFSKSGRRWSTLVHLALAFTWPIAASIIITAVTYAATFTRDNDFFIGLKVALEGPVEGYYIEGLGFVMGLLSYLFTMAVACAYVYYRRFREAQIQNLQLETQLMTAQVQALRMQLHPHFFFNTLNSISSLLQVDSKAADRMLSQLGDLWRTTVAQADVPMVPLRDEIAFLHAYLAIEQVRFQDRLIVTFEVPSDAEQAEVPNLILQPLVENAIHHGISKRIAPGWIRVESRRDGRWLVLRVCDSGPGIPDAMLENNLLFEAGIGLSNTHARLRQLYGTDATIEAANMPESGCCLTLRFPYTPYADSSPA